MKRKNEYAQSSRSVQASPFYLQSFSPPFLRPRSMIIVPSSALETMNLGAMGGLAALSQTGSQTGNRVPKTSEADSE